MRGRSLWTVQPDSAELWENKKASEFGAPLLTHGISKTTVVTRLPLLAPIQIRIGSLEAADFRSSGRITFGINPATYSLHSDHLTEPTGYPKVRRQPDLPRLYKKRAASARSDAARYSGVRFFRITSKVSLQEEEAAAIGACSELSLLGTNPIYRFG